MESTCSELLDLCLNGLEWPDELLDRAIAEDDGRRLLGVVVERLADLFEPRLCEVYSKLFSQVIARVCPELGPRVRACPLPDGRGSDALASSRDRQGADRRVYVLSRITLGADVAVTSVLLDAAKRKYPNAEIFLAGPRKNYELFEADSRIRHYPLAYGRGTLRERLRASGSFWIDDGIVIDSDSRITQLGLIQICPEDRYCFFESRSVGGDGMDRLPNLAARWAGDPKAKPYVAPVAASGVGFDITVSLGVGENPAKRVDDAFERELLKLLSATGASILVDKGGSKEERDRVERVLLPGMQTHDGAFAPFTAQIVRSKLFVGYDSAAGHVASACGVPLISIAKGFVNARAAARWRPLGTVIDGNAPDVLDRVQDAITYTFRR